MGREFTYGTSIEDVAHVTGQIGQMALAVRNDALTALAADGDYIPLMVGADGSLTTTDINAGLLAALINDRGFGADGLDVNIIQSAVRVPGELQGRLEYYLEEYALDGNVLQSEVLDKQGCAHFMFACVNANVVIWTFDISQDNANWFNIVTTGAQLTFDSMNDLPATFNNFSPFRYARCGHAAGAGAGVSQIVMVALP